MRDRRSNIESDLVALADGSLPPELHERALARVSAQPEYSGALDTQQRAVELVRSVQVIAPASLHRQVSGMFRSEERTSSPRARVASIGALGAVAAAVLAILIANLGSAGRTPAFAEISALTLRAPTAAAATESATNRNQLATSVEGVAFPYWNEHFRWKANGMRVDRLAGRSITTVFYESPQGRHIGYAIVSGGTQPPSGGTVFRRNGVSYRLITSHGVPAVTWQRAGHLCVISSRSVSARTLLRLASWDDSKRTV
jgi:hypothetical protein